MDVVEIDALNIQHDALVKSLQQQIASDKVAFTEALRDKQLQITNLQDTVEVHTTM